MKMNGLKLKRLLSRRWLITLAAISAGFLLGQYVQSLATNPEAVLDSTRLLAHKSFMLGCVTSVNGMCKGDQGCRSVNIEVCRSSGNTYLSEVSKILRLEEKR